jgi:hypothetical protein
VIYLLRRPSAEGIEERETMFLIHLPLNHYGPIAPVVDVASSSSAYAGYSTVLAPQEDSCAKVVEHESAQAIRC